MFSGICHENAYNLAKKLSDFINFGDEYIKWRSFFVESGSIAVEVAIKIAIQYWYNLGYKNKKIIASCIDGYHGDSFATMSVSDGDSFFHQYSAEIFGSIKLKIPSNDLEWEIFANSLYENKGKIAAFIIEPLLQGAGGMKLHSSDTLKRMYEICKKLDILFIVDEIAVAFYRLGTKLASIQAGIIPDIIIVGKALSGGTLPIASTMVHPNIFESFNSKDVGKVFMHGPTYMANPLACAASIASIDIFNNTDYSSKVKYIESKLLVLNDLKNHANVNYVSIKGAMAAISTNFNYEKIHYIRKNVSKYGVWLRPFSNIIYIMPPLIIKDDELDILINAVINLVSG